MKDLWKTLLVTALLPLIALAFLNCSDDDDVVGPVGGAIPAGTGSDPGTGSNSLLVNAEVNGRDIGEGHFETDFLVVLRDTADNPVNDATVTISHAQLGNLTLTQDTPAPGEYENTISDYVSGTYILTVSRGADFISDAKVLGLDIHNIVFPTPSDTLRSDSSFTVVWSRRFIADSAKFETRDFSPTWTTDDGNSVVPASFNPRNNQRIKIWRRHTITLAGGRPGSDFRMEIRNSVEGVVVE